MKKAFLIPKAMTSEEDDDDKDDVDDDDDDYEGNGDGYDGFWFGQNRVINR